MPCAEAEQRVLGKVQEMEKDMSPFERRELQRKAATIKATERIVKGSPPGVCGSAFGVRGHARPPPPFQTASCR
jgi:hypothetical protein